MRIVTIISITAGRYRWSPRLRTCPKGAERAAEAVFPHGGAPSGGQPVDRPAPTHLPGPPLHAPVAQTVMQPERTSLPELHRVGFKEVPAPEIGHRDLPGLRPAPLQLGDAV